ncbi:hypothetical protein BC828DRAFT_409969 [Blastocladiella britannica]|nr:hypothetical protein BC828DRAFT_409969 [Blastocladiella britannica]
MSTLIALLITSSFVYDGVRDQAPLATIHGAPKALPLSSSMTSSLPAISLWRHRCATWLRPRRPPHRKWTMRLVSSPQRRAWLAIGLAGPGWMPGDVADKGSPAGYALEMISAMFQYRRPWRTAGSLAYAGGIAKHLHSRSLIKRILSVGFGTRTILPGGLTTL